MNFNKLSVALVASLCASGILGGVVAEAADTPAFEVIPLTSQSGLGNGFSHGPFAVALGEGSDPSVVSRYFKNDAYTFFNLAPQMFNEGDRILHINSCYSYLDSKLCDGYWWKDNGTYQWRRDLLDQVSQVSSAVNGAVSQDYEMTYEAVGDGTDGVGSIAGAAKKYGYRELLGIAKFGGKTYILKSPAELDAEHGDYAQAFSYYKLSDGRILVGGLARVPTFEEEYYERCYYGDWDRYLGSDYAFCPGFKVQATIWLIDPNTLSDGAVVTGVQPQAFFNVGATDRRLTIGNVRGFTEVGDKIYAVGHSTSKDLSSSKVYVGGVAVYWPLTIDASGVSFADNGNEFKGLERPGKGDGENLYTDVKAINSQGYAIINRKMNASVNSNYPKIFAVSKINTDGSTERVIYPLIDDPIRGADSEASGLNDNGFVVGWRDARSENSPVNYGIARSQEGFIYSINDKTSYFLNDLICSNPNGQKNCEVNGKYYAIGWPVAINNDNTILATAFEYDSFENYSNMMHSKTVNVLLKPNAEAFKEVTPDAAGGEAQTSYLSIDPSFVVSNEQNMSNEAQINKKGRGAFDGFGLITLLGLGAMLRRRKQQIKA